MNRIEVFRESTKKVVAMLAQKKIQVTQRGTSAYVKYDNNGMPKQVNIPFIPDNATDDLLHAIQGFVDHEVAHIFFTDPKCMSAVSVSNNEPVKKMANLIEDSRIEKLMTEKFSGSGHNLRNVGEFFLKNITDKIIAETPEQTVSALIVPAMRAWAGQSVYIDYMQDKWPLMQKVTDALGDSINDVAKCKSTEDAFILAKKFVKLLDIPDAELNPDGDGDPSDGDGESKESGDGKGKSKKKSDKKEKGKENTEPSDDGSDGQSDDSEEDSDDSPESSGSSDSDEDGDEEGSDKGSGNSDEKDDKDGGKDEQGSGGSGDSLPSPDDDGGKSGEKGDGESEGDSNETSKGGKAPKPQSILQKLNGFADVDFDEAVAKELSKVSAAEIGKSEYIAYTKDHDKIEPLRMSDDTHQLTLMANNVDHMVGPLQKDLERAIAARSRVAWSPGHRSGRLNPTSLSRLVAFNDTRVFRRKQVSNSKDVAVSLLIDMSGSMSDCNKIAVAADTAYALVSVLERLNVPSEILGFTTKGYTVPDKEESEGVTAYSRIEKLFIPIVKGFGDRLSPETMKRFATLRNPSGMMQYNIDGESVEIAASRLAKRKEARKILIVLSDGHPAGYGSSADLYNHLKKVNGEVEAAGIDLLGIGIMSDAVSQFYSKYVVLSNVQELPVSVIKEIKALLMKS